MKRLQRLDLLLVERGLTSSPDLARRLVMAGKVRVDDQVVLLPGKMVPVESEITLQRSLPYASRGGEKLAGALQAFPIQVTGQVCADVGASTGGFTDCLLQHGAARVYAIDVGKGILAWRLRQDPRVVILEETNARHLSRLPEPVTLVTVDVSFISLKIILPVIRDWLNPGATNDLIPLIKPQFEAGRKQTAQGKGVIRDPGVHRQVLLDVLGFATTLGYTVKGLLRASPLGPKGNQEFLAWLRFPMDQETVATSLEELVQRVLPP